jgi:hypothetical protein
LDKGNEIRIESGFPVVEINGGKAMKDSRYGMSKVNEFDRIVAYNLKPGYKESFGFGVSFKRK